MPFEELPSAAEYPSYYQITAKPLALDTVDRRVAQGEYATLEAFVDDVVLIAHNALQFNAPRSAIYNSAVRLVEALADGVAVPARVGKPVAEARDRKRPLNEATTGPADVMVELTGAAADAVAVEAEQLRTALAELARIGAIPARTVLSFGKHMAVLGPDGVFRDELAAPVPALAVMRQIIAAGGYGMYGWAPVSIGGLTIAQLRVRADPRCHRRELEMELETPARFMLWRTEAEYPAWLATRKTHWRRVRLLHRKARVADTKLQRSTKRRTPSSSSQAGATPAAPAVDTATPALPVPSMDGKQRIFALAAALQCSPPVRTLAESAYLSDRIGFAAYFSDSFTGTQLVRLCLWWEIAV